MKTARFVLLGAAMLAAGAAFAQQQNQTGMLTMIDRIDHNVAIQRQPNGTTGSSGGAIDVFKVPQNLSLENVHVGDKVMFSASDSGGVKTITKLEKQ
jgi:hypothetical protein